MELYEIKEKVGSDPCLVLDFDAEVTINGASIEFSADMKTFENSDEANKFVNDFTNLIESLTQTRCVLFRFKTSEQAPISFFANAVIVSTGISFNTAAGLSGARTLNVLLSIGTIVQLVSLTAVHDEDKYIVRFLGTATID